MISEAVTILVAIYAKPGHQVRHTVSEFKRAVLCLGEHDHHTEVQFLRRIQQKGEAIHNAIWPGIRALLIDK